MRAASLGLHGVRVCGRLCAHGRHLFSPDGLRASGWSPRRCCLYEWLAIPDLARTRSRPTGQASHARPTTGRPRQQATPPPTAAHADRPGRPRSTRQVSAEHAASSGTPFGAKRRRQAPPSAVTRAHAPTHDALFFWKAYLSIECTLNGSRPS